MQHLDEGTVHAWLDGELSADEAERAARHAAECAQCGALVAEARGVLAGASRIVSALDAGPAGVVPPAQRAVETKRRSWYRFALTPARMSIAATLLVAAGVTLTVQRSRLDREDTPPSRMIDTPAAMAPAAVATPDSLAPAPLPRAAKAVQSAPAAAQKEKSNVVASKPEAPVVGVVGGTPIGNKKTTIESNARDAEAVEKAPAPAIANAPSGAPAPAAAPAPVSVSMAARLDSVRAKDEAASAGLAGDRARPTLARQQAFSANQLKTVATSEHGPAATNAPLSQDCYRVAIDSTSWRGALPSTFALAPAVTGTGRGGSAGVAAPQPAAAAEFAMRVQLANPWNVVHGVTADGRVDSLVVGDWRQSSPSVVTVRFAAAAQRKPVSLLLPANSSTGRLISVEGTDSVHVVHMTCTR